MGAGDVKLAAVIALMAGFPYVFVALFLAIVSGGVAGAILLATGRKGRMLSPSAHFWRRQE